MLAALVGLSAACGVMGGAGAQANTPVRLSDADQAFSDRMKVIPVARYAAALFPSGGPTFVKLKVILLDFDLRSRPEVAKGLAPRPTVPVICVSQRVKGSLAQLEPLRIKSKVTDYVYFAAPATEAGLATDADREAYCARQDPGAFAEAPSAEAFADAAMLFQTLLAIPPSDRKSRVRVSCEQEEAGGSSYDYRRGPLCGLGSDHLAAMTEVEEIVCKGEFADAELLRLMRGPACLRMTISDLSSSRESMRFASFSIVAERGKRAPHFYLLGGDSTLSLHSKIPQALRCTLAEGVEESPYITAPRAIGQRFRDDFEPISSLELPARGGSRQFILLWSRGPRWAFAFQDDGLRFAVYDERLDGSTEMIGTFTATAKDFCSVGAQALGAVGR